MAWSSLPTELRAIIFHYLKDIKDRQYQPPHIQQSQRKKATKSTRGVQSQYAAVNREWQAYFEAYNFNRLILGHSDVGEFGKIVSRSHRGPLVRWIWLRVELLKYGCDKCSKQESLEERTAHEARLTLAMRDLLGYLSELDADDHPGVSLELSVHSPSDSEHHCKELRRTMNDTAWHAPEIYAPIRYPNDRVHRWRNGHRPPLKTEASLRVFGNPKGIGIVLESTYIWPYKRLPKAEVVKEFVIRLQFLRHFSVRRGLVPITQSLSRLESLRYECRRGLNVGAGSVTGQTFRQREHELLLDYILHNCKSLRRLSIYEASNRTYCKNPSPVVPDPIGGRALGVQSRLLREVYVSWMVEARDFFHNFWPGATPEQQLERTEWKRLRYLSLTTSLIPSTHCESLMQAAAAAAERMPKLKTMELWGFERRDRFLYLVQAGQHTIFVPKGMACTLSATTIQHWQRVAATRGSPYNLKVEDLPEYIIGSQTYPPSIAWRSATRTTLKLLDMEHDNHVANF